MKAVPFPDAQVICVDCGGVCYPLGWHPGDDELEPGTVLPYRCTECNDRWDIVIGDDESSTDD